MTKLRSGWATDVGMVRSNNQDRATSHPTLCAVADGMGGHKGGEVAAQLAIDALTETFLPRGTPDSLLEAVKAANRAVWERSASDESLRGMGTTLTAVALVRDENKDRLALVNVGDSRTYLLRDGALSQVTADHSLVEEMVRAGEISAEEAAVHPSRHVLTRALGIEPVVEVDSWLLEPTAGDRFLLCSDGLINEVSSAEMAEVLSDGDDPTAVAERLVDLAKSHGGSDNITVVVLDVVDAPALGEWVDSETASRSSLAKSDALAAEAEPSGLGGGTSPSGSGERVRDAPRRVTVRVVLFILLLLVVLGGSVGAVWWYDHNSYFVTLRSNQLVIEQGRPQGLLWLQPKVVDQTGVMDTQVLPSHLGPLKSGVEEPSLAAAKRYVANLVNEYSMLSTPPAPSPAPTTATTVAGATPGKVG